MIYRGNIVEVCNDSIVVITEECTFERIKKSAGLEEGMEVYFEERDIIRKSNTTVRNISKMAAAIILLVITSIYGIQFWDINYRPVAIVSIDINPSVEIKINRNHRVINASPLNEDALNLSLKKLKGQILVNALDELVQIAKSEGYVKENEENYILLAVVGLNHYEKDTEALEQLLAEGKEKIETVSNEHGQHIEVVTVESNKETLKKARKEHISVGKMEVYESIKDNNKDGQSSKQKINELKEEKIKELIEKIGKEHPRNNNPSDKDKKKIKDEKFKEEKEEGIGQNKDKDIDKGKIKDKDKDKDSKDKGKDSNDKGNKDKDNDKDKDSKNKDNKDKIKKEKDHPVFEEHPGNNKANKPSK